MKDFLKCVEDSAKEADIEVVVRKCLTLYTT